MDVASLASAGATAIISAMATDAWSWARTELARLFGRRESAREQDETARLNGFADDLSRVAERDVHNRLLGYLEARLSDEVSLRNDFLAIVRKICTEVGLDPPTVHMTQRVVATNSVVVQTSGGPAQVTVGAQATPMIKWAAMTGPEAARKLEEMELDDSVVALADMEPALAARRFSHVQPDRAEQLLAHMDEGLAADLLSKLDESTTAASLLSRIEPSRAAAILDVTNADWAVARLAEMNPDRALVVLGCMGTTRTDDLLAAMQRQEAVRLLGAVSKVLSEQARVRKTLDFAQQEVGLIANEARRKADEIIEKAQVDAGAIRAAAQGMTVQDVQDDDRLDTDAGSHATSQDHSEPTFRVDMDQNVKARAADFDLSRDIFLLSHDIAGRPRINQAIVETGVAGAVLCDLVRSDRVDIVDGRVRSTTDQFGQDAVGEFALRAMVTEPSQLVQDWIRDERKELFHVVAQRLAERGFVVPTAKSLSTLWSGVRYKAASETAASAPGVRVVGLLVSSAEAPDESTYVLAHLVYLTQLHEALPMRLRQRQIRDLLAELVKANEPRPALRAVLNGIDTAIAKIAMNPKAR